MSSADDDRKDQPGSYLNAMPSTRFDHPHYCPICGSPEASRERRMDGNSKCSRGHTYPSKDASTVPLPLRDVQYAVIDLLNSNKPVESTSINHTLDTVSGKTTTQIEIVRFTHNPRPEDLVRSERVDMLLKGIAPDPQALSAHHRRPILRAILADYNINAPGLCRVRPQSYEGEVQLDGAENVCFHLYSKPVAERMAEVLKVDVNELRKALDLGLQIPPS